MCPKIADISDFWTCFAIFRYLRGALDSCRGDPKLQNEYSNIKIRQELTSEMRKM